MLLDLLINRFMSWFFCIFTHKLPLHFTIIVVLLDFLIIAFRTGVKNCGAKLSIKKLSQLVKKLNSWDFNLLRVTLLFTFMIIHWQIFIFFVVSYIMNELPKQMLHQMQNTDRCYLIWGHLNQVVPDFGFLWVQISSLYEDFLLLSNGIFEEFHPWNNVTMRNWELVGSSNFDQLIKWLFIFGLRELEGKLFNLQLSLE